MRLEALGGLTLTNKTGSLPVTQRRRLALLALLAVAGERGLSRDKLVAFLWPESASDSARHSLEQLVYGLRRELGESLFLSGSQLRLNPEVVVSDVDAFERALARGAFEEAAGLYRGAFLDGFFLADAPEFERWVDAERRRLAELYASALDRLALDEVAGPSCGSGWHPAPMIARCPR